MNIEKSTLEIGLDKPLKILHITDNHLPLYDENDGPDIVSKGKKRKQKKKNSSSAQQEEQDSASWHNSNPMYEEFEE